MEYKSCGFIHHGLEFRYTNQVVVCPQVSHVGGGKLMLLENFTEKTFDIDKLLQNRKQILDAVRNGLVSPNCLGCMDLKEMECPKEEPKIKILFFQHWTKCNSKCIYCYTAENKKYYNSCKTYKILPLLKRMLKLDLLDKNGLVNFSGGEVTLLKEFAPTVKLLDKLNYYIIVNSSGVDYSSTIGKYLKKGNGCLIISLDAGTKSVHEKIKGVKTYNRIWKNIRKYVKLQAQDHLVNIKYIIVPGYNDTEEEIDVFLQCCNDAGVKNVVLGIDVNYFEPHRDNIPERILNLFESTRIKAEKMGLSFYIANRATTMLTKGKYANEFWEKYRYDDGVYSNIYFEHNRI